MLLKLIEIETSAHDAPKLEQQQTARKLKRILQMFRNGIAILDEVDLILHPLKSELTFSLGRRYALSQKHRYMIPEFLVRATFGCDLAELHGDEHSQLKAYFKGMHKTYATVFRDQELIDPKSYSVNFHGMGCLKQSYATLLVCYLRFHFSIGDHLKASLFNFIFEKRDFREVPVRSDDCHSDYVAVAEMCYVWCQELLPHILSKQHRVNYGLTAYDDSSVATVGEDRFLKAVPFLGKELPSPDSEFSSMDVTFGFTALSFMKQPLRLRDVKGLVSYMQKNASSSDHLQAQTVFNTWRQWMVDRAEGREFWNLEAIELQNPIVIEKLHALVAQMNVWQLKQYYLLHIVFPAISSFSKESISADAVDMSDMFSLIFGFSGTLTKNVYPLSWGKEGGEFTPNLNDDDQTRMKTVLCDLTCVNIVYMVQYSDKQWRIVSDENQSRNFESSWKVQDLLEAVATQTEVSCLIDCGALVTGLSNDEVAAFFMNLKNDDHRFEAFRNKFSVCVFWDSSDAPVALEREGSAVIQLSACSKPVEEWFVYFDHVHTTGIDLLLPRSAVAVVTIGSDTVLRDYQQACWRLRQLGHGQRVQVVLVPEIHRLFVKAASVSDDTSTLQALDNLTLQGGLQPRNLFAFLEAKQNKAESRQLLCLRMRELHVWRQRCIHNMGSSNEAESKQLARKFIRTHNEDSVVGKVRDPQEPNYAFDPDELQQLQIVNASIECLLLCASSPRSRSAQQHSWDALAVQQKQQQAQQEKEALRENPQPPFHDAPVTSWSLPDFLFGSKKENPARRTRPRQFRKISKQFSFFPDFLYASKTFAAAFDDEVCGVRVRLPKAEIVLEIKSRDASIAIAHKIVFVTLAEAETLFRMLSMNPHHEYAQLCTMHALDYHGYCSQLLPSATIYSDACRAYLFSAPLRDIDGWFKSPSPLCVATAYARFFNCELDFDIFQGTCIANALQTWNSSHAAARAAKGQKALGASAAAALTRADVAPKGKDAAPAVEHEDPPPEFTEEDFRLQEVIWAEQREKEAAVRDHVFACFRTLSSRRPALAVDPLRSRVLVIVSGALADPISSLSKVRRWQSAAFACMRLARLLSCVKMTSREASGGHFLDLDTQLQHAWNEAQKHVDVFAAHPDGAASAYAIFGASGHDRIALSEIFSRLRPIIADLTLEGIADAFELVM
jgi:hypothetical protein